MLPAAIRIGEFRGHHGCCPWREVRKIERRFIEAKQLMDRFETKPRVLSESGTRTRFSSAGDRLDGDRCGVSAEAQTRRSREYTESS